MKFIKQLLLLPIIFACFILAAEEDAEVSIAVIDL